jgi:hypothetical protein
MRPHSAIAVSPRGYTDTAFSAPPAVPRPSVIGLLGDVRRERRRAQPAPPHLASLHVRRVRCPKEAAPVSFVLPNVTHGHSCQSAQALRSGSTVTVLWLGRYRPHRARSRSVACGTTRPSCGGRTRSSQLSRRAGAHPFVCQRHWSGRGSERVHEWRSTNPEANISDGPLRADLPGELVSPACLLGGRVGPVSSEATWRGSISPPRMFARRSRRAFSSVVA